MLQTPCQIFICIQVFYNSFYAMLILSIQCLFYLGSFGTVLASQAIRAAHCLTSIQVCCF